MNVNRSKHPLLMLLLTLLLVAAIGQPATAQGHSAVPTGGSNEPGPDSRSDSAIDTCGREGCLFPQDPLFHPLIADPKQPRFFASFFDYESTTEQFLMASVGYGEDFGVYRWGNASDSGAFQIGLLGGLFAQFNLDTRSNDLLNADYTIGFPLEYRYEKFALRFRLYHQSSHLGDEFLLKSDTDRINLSFEALELLGSYELADWRVYGGGEYLLHRYPEDLERPSVRAGLEYIGGEGLGDVGTLVGGLDYRSFQEHNWDDEYSIKLGVELHRPDSIQRHIRILFEAYDGHSPFGQFYTRRIEYVGVGLHLGL